MALWIHLGNGYFYIGVQEFPQQHSWVYISSREPVESSDWGLGEPDVGSNENCVLIAEKPSNMGHWADVQCSRLEHFVCQKRLAFQRFLKSLDIFILCKNDISFINFIELKIILWVLWDNQIRSGLTKSNKGIYSPSTVFDHLKIFKEWFLIT